MWWVGVPCPCGPYLGSGCFCGRQAPCCITLRSVRRLGRGGGEVLCTGDSSGIFWLAAESGSVTCLTAPNLCGCRWCSLSRVLGAGSSYFAFGVTPVHLPAFCRRVLVRLHAVWVHIQSVSVLRAAVGVFVQGWGLCRILAGGLGFRIVGCTHAGVKVSVC